MTQHAIDLTRHAFMRPYKDLVVFGTWLYNDDQEDHEPALVILPRYRRNGFKPVCIALSALHLYNSARYMARASRQFNADLGFEDSMANSHKVADAIHEHMRDLIMMPENPTQTVVVGEVTIRRNGNKETTAEVLDHVSLAQA
jgi:hypothetical protein